MWRRAHARVGFDRRPSASAGAAWIGGLAAVLVGLLGIPFRQAIGPANIALLLALAIVCAGAAGGALPAVTTSVAASLVFNVLHTRPYLSLAIIHRTDMITTAMLLFVGMISGIATERGWRHRERELERTRQLESLHEVAESAVEASSAAAIWPQVRELLCREMHLGSCWFEPKSGEQFPFARLSHRGHLETAVRVLKYQRSGFELPRNGVEIELSSSGRELGRLVMLPDPGHGLSLVDRRFAVAVADQFAQVAGRDPELTALW